MIRLLPLILATCMVGEAGWTVQIEHTPIEYACYEETTYQQTELVYQESELVYQQEEPETYAEPETEASGGEWEYLGTHRVTGYTWTGNTMANGVYPSYGWCACNGLPLGSRVYIEGLGYFTVGDRGGMSDPYWIDVYFDTVSECYQVTGYYDVYLVEE